MNLTAQADKGLALRVRYRLDKPAAGPVMLGLGGVGLDVAPKLTAGPWGTVEVRLTCLAKSGADLTAVSEGFRLATPGPLAITLEDIRLAPAQGPDGCP